MDRSRIQSIELAQTVRSDLNRLKLGAMDKMREILYVLVK